jgi:pyridoxamine 5'-phosphate oxidase
MSEPLYDESSLSGVPLLDLEELRQELMRKGLSEADARPDPFEQFAHWYRLVQASQIRLPEAMTLATATPDGRPSARMVLLKGADPRGLVFFTHYQSRKGKELAANPHAALVLYWKELDRQVRVEGRVESVAPEESDAYFQTRPWRSRVSASVSPQSEVVSGREVLERRFGERLAEYPDGHVPRPALWGGYRLIPDVFEFWQGRPDRLHDRLRYTRAERGGWRIERLAP